MFTIADRIILLWGWQRALVAFVAGAIGALALAPIGFAPALIVTMTVAVWLLDGCTSEGGGRSWATLRAAALIGWWLGFGYFIAGLWWLGSAFLVEADQFAWALPLGVIGLPAGLAVFTALGFVLAKLMWPSNAARILALAAGLGVAEWLRGTILTGFPWNSYGMALAGVPVFAQTAALIGLPGLTLLAVAIAASPALLGTGMGQRERWTAPLFAGLLLVLMAGGGAIRLYLAETTDVAGVRFRVMQPNVPQDAKFRPENGEEILRRYLTLTSGNGNMRQPALTGITHVVWPESAFPFILSRQPAALAQISALLRPNATLITGAVREGQVLPGETARHYYNSILVIGADGSILSSADKVHLVPFGEYLPLSNVLTWLGLRQFVHAPGAFDAGDRLRLLPVPGLTGAVPLICYEAIFPGEVTPDGERPQLLLNVTNDAWFGLTPGPHQHFAQARLRTIEEGLPMVRAANTGISAVIDSYGRVRTSLRLGQEGSFDANLPTALSSTVFSWIGHWAAALMATIFAVVALTNSRRRT